uniref:Limb development membrane protein 1 like n=1 Tax=Anser cygnoides TaxID=8845 RepID=A0A8B9IPZ6_ANSCY
MLLRCFLPPSAAPVPPQPTFLGHPSLWGISRGCHRRGAEPQLPRERCRALQLRLGGEAAGGEKQGAILVVCSSAVHDDEDAAVNRIALGMCTFTLAVALGAVLLLPFSIISNEVLLSFPHNYYIQWLNGSLIHGLWNLVFLFSNMSLVFLMPFAYFFTESEGFAGSKKGIMARVYETSVVLLLLTLLVLGMVWVASAIVGNNAASRQSLYDLWEYYLPYLYSCISLFGVLLLLPPGRPGRAAELHEVRGSRRVPQDHVRQSFLLAEPERGAAAGAAPRHPEQKAEAGAAAPSVALAEEPGLPPGHAGPPGADRDLGAHRLLPRPGTVAGRCRDATGYPGCAPGPGLLLHLRHLWSCPAGHPHLVSFTRAPVAVPCAVPCAVPSVLSLTPPRSYLMLSSVVGFYSSPLFTRLLPERQDTPLTKIIGNCVSLLVLSSALPVFSRTLGITRFDLLGDFGRFNWLGNFYIVFLYNMGFAALTTLCLVKKVTWAVQEELLRAFGLHKLPLPVPRSRPLGERC